MNFDRAHAAWEATWIDGPKGEPDEEEPEPEEPQIARPRYASWDPDTGTTTHATLDAAVAAVREYDDIVAACGVERHPDIGAYELVPVGQESAPPADVSLLASANRTLAADLEAARAEISEAMAILDAGAESLGDGTPVPTTLVQRARNVTMALAAEAGEANRLRDEIRAEVTRLTRILAVERGDQTQAPAGWAWVDGAWVGPGLVRLIRRDSGEWAWWDGRAVRTWPSALEAMEAIDAERGGVPHA